MMLDDLKYLAYYPKTPLVIYVIILGYFRLTKQFGFDKIDLGMDILRLKMVFAWFYLSTDIVNCK